MPHQHLIFFNNLSILTKNKKEKTELKIIKYKNSDLIHFKQEHNRRLKALANHVT